MHISTCLTSTESFLLKTYLHFIPSSLSRSQPDILKNSWKKYLYIIHFIKSIVPSSTYRLDASTCLLIFLFRNRLLVTHFSGAFQSDERITNHFLFLQDLGIGQSFVMAVKKPGKIRCEKSTTGIVRAFTTHGRARVDDRRQSTEKRYQALHSHDSIVRQFKSFCTGENKLQKLNGRERKLIIN